MADEFFCGIVKIPKNKILGTPQQCVRSKQIRYYGKVAIDPDMLIKPVHIKTADDYRKTALEANFKYLAYKKKYDSFLLKLKLIYEDFDKIYDTLTQAKQQRLAYKIAKLESEKLIMRDRYNLLVRQYNKAVKEAKDFEEAEKQPIKKSTKKSTKKKRAKKT